MYTGIDKTMQIVLERGSIDAYWLIHKLCMQGVSNPNVPIFPPRVCTLVLFIIYSYRVRVPFGSGVARH